MGIGPRLNAFVSPPPNITTSRSCMFLKIVKANSVYCIKPEIKNQVDGESVWKRTHREKVSVPEKSSLD